jgi:hypothetical protein
MGQQATGEAGSRSANGKRSECPSTVYTSRDGGQRMREYSQKLEIPREGERRLQTTNPAGTRLSRGSMDAMRQGESGDWCQGRNGKILAIALLELVRGFFVGDIPPKVPPDRACYPSDLRASGHPFMYAMLIPIAKNKPVRAENVRIVPGWTSCASIIPVSGASPVTNWSRSFRCWPARNCGVVGPKAHDNAGG